METEKSVEKDFDFFKKNTAITAIKNKVPFVKDKESKKSKSSSAIPTGFWGMMLIGISLIGLFNHIEYAGWVMFFGVLKLDDKKGWKTFFLSVLGLIGLSLGIEYSGWLLFLAFIVD